MLKPRSVLQHVFVIGAHHLGDSLTTGESLQFTGLPFFAPELFRMVEVADPMRNKQLRAGLAQLGEEGVIQVFRPLSGGPLLLGAVGALQFEVVAHRLQHEYSADVRIQGTKYTMARWIAADDAMEMKRFMEANAHRVAYDVLESPTFLAASPGELEVVQGLWPAIRFYALREQAGQLFNTPRAAA